MTEVPFVMRNANGQLLPGFTANPSGRPKMPVSITKILKERLEKHPDQGEQIVDSLMKLANKPDMGALALIIERIDGKVASEVNFKGIMVHVGDDYAKQGIETLTKDLESRKVRYLGVSDVSPSAGNNAQNEQIDQVVGEVVVDTIVDDDNPLNETIKRIKGQ